MWCVVHNRYWMLQGVFLPTYLFSPLFVESVLLRCHTLPEITMWRDAIAVWRIFCHVPLLSLFTRVCLSFITYCNISWLCHLSSALPSERSKLHGWFAATGLSMRSTSKSLLRHQFPGIKEMFHIHLTAIPSPARARRQQYRRPQRPRICIWFTATCEQCVLWAPGRHRASICISCTNLATPEYF